MNDEDTTYVLTHPDHGTIRNVRVSQDAREQTDVELPLSISGFAHWQDADYLRAMGWTITAAQSPATVPGDHDELLAEADRLGLTDADAPDYGDQYRRFITRLTTALRTEQRARQEAVVERDALQQRIEAYQKVVFDPISDYYGEIRTKFDAIDNSALTAPTASKTPTPEPIRSSSAEREL